MLIISKKMMNLKEYFGHSVVINLDRFPDRWEKFQADAVRYGIEGFERLRAIEGDQSPPPTWWKAGNGAWGCLMSHLRGVQDAIHNGAGHYLVFEDDAILSDDFCERLPRVLEEAGEDWDMIYLGGAHLHHCGRPKRIAGKEEIIRAMNVNRTQGFIVHERFRVKFAQHIIHAPDYIAASDSNPKAPWHIDHQLGNLHDPNSDGGGRRDFVIFAAHPWLCGQRAGDSWISGKRNERERWWHNSDRKIDPAE